MGNRGAEFAELEPRSVQGLINTFQQFDMTSNDLEHGVPFPIIAEAYGLNPSTSPAAINGFNAFRIGQQILFWIGISNTIFGSGETENWITSLRLKPWWLRNNLEYRPAGWPAWTGLDSSTFLGISNSDNKYVWIPSPKRLDITQYQVPPPVAAQARTSDSLMLDDVWKWDLQDPNDTDYQEDFPDPQEVSRWSVFFYPAMGYSLAFTWEAEYANDVETTSQPLPRVSLTYALGTLGGSVYQESLG